MVENYYAKGFAKLWNECCIAVLFFCCFSFFKDVFLLFGVQLLHFCSIYLYLYLELKRYLYTLGCFVFRRLTVFQVVFEF